MKRAGALLQPRRRLVYFRCRWVPTSPWCAHSADWRLGSRQGSMVSMLIDVQLVPQRMKLLNVTSCALQSAPCFTLISRSLLMSKNGVPYRKLEDILSLLRSGLLCS